MPNTSTASRTGTITIASQTFTLTQAGGASANAPTIAQGGIVNAANNRGGGIAQGSFFTIYGSNLGPATPQQVYQFPIPDNLGGVTVTVTQGSTTVKAYMFYVSATQINAIMPSNAPLGNVQIAVNYNGVVSTAAAATIVKTAFGIFSTAGGPGPGIILNYNSATDQPLNLASIPAKPGQVEVMWGTGLGPITTPDNQPPPGGNLPVAVQVYGRRQASQRGVQRPCARQRGHRPNQLHGSRQRAHRAALFRCRSTRVEPGATPFAWPSAPTEAIARIASIRCPA